MKNNDIKDLFQLFTPGVEHKEDLYNKILEKSKEIKNNKKEHIPVKHFKTGVLAATLICCFLTVTAFAAVQFGLDIEFLKFLKPSSDTQADYLASGAYAVNQKVSNENGTLEIKQVIGDNNLTYILMDFTAPAGVVLNAERYWFENSSCDAGKDIYTGKRFILVDDDNPNDNKISLVMEIITQKSTMGEKAIVYFENLQAAAAYPAEFQTVITGSWETSFDLDFKDYSITQSLDTDLLMFDYEAKLKEISISPISIALKIESPLIREISKVSDNIENNNANEFIDRFPITINYKDGTSETTDIFHGSLLSNFPSGKMELVKTFENVINDKEILSIVFFNAEVPIY